MMCELSNTNQKRWNEDKLSKVTAVILPSKESAVKRWIKAVVSVE